MSEGKTFLKKNEIDRRKIFDENKLTKHYEINTENLNQQEIEKILSQFTEKIFFKMVLPDIKYIFSILNQQFPLDYNEFCDNFLNNLETALIHLKNSIKRTVVLDASFYFIHNCNSFNMWDAKIQELK